MSNPYPKGSTLAWCYSNGRRQSYYHRSTAPFYYTQDSVLNGDKVEGLGTLERAAFVKGYRENEDYKDYG